MQDKLSELLELFKDEDTQEPPTVQHEKRLQRVKRTLKLAEALEVRETRRQKSLDIVLPLLGASMLGVALVYLFSSVPGMSEVFSGWGGSTLTSFGYVLMLVAAIFVGKALASSPLEDLSSHLDRFDSRLLNAIETKERAPLRRLQQPDRKILAGVAAKLARQSGIPVGFMRFLFIVSGFFSGGATVLAYIVLAFVLPSEETAEPA